MASVAVISSALAKINCFKGQFRTLPDGANQLLAVLDDVKKSLIAADGENPKVEREIVHLSYDIVDAIADAVSKKPTKKLQELRRRLDGLHDKLRNKKPAVSSIRVLVLTSNQKIKQTGSKKNADSEEKEEEENPGTYVDILQWVQGKSSSVLFIVGKSGIESACTRKLCDKLRNDSRFEFCAWIWIDHNFTIRRVLQVLLQKLAPRLGIGDMKDIELINEIFATLEKKKNYLLVLDGVRTAGDWESIRLALSISGSSRVIITSSCTGFSPSAEVYKISSMNLDGIREVLQNEGSFKPGLEKYAETIFGASGGSPVLATILGKSLQSKENPEEQQQLVNELTSYKLPKGESKVLAACYKWLAPELKPCLLYLSQFQRGQEIDVEKLYLLLAAENLIFPLEGSQVCLGSLIKHLEELANRNLVEVHEDIIRSRRGNNKSYRLLLQVQEFCISKATEENFLQIVDMGNPKTMKIKNYTRRLVVHLSNKEANMSIQFESQVILKEILSLLIFDTSETAEEKSKLPKKLTDLKEFIHLRILKFDGINFGVRNVPKGINTLVLLRYLSFRGCWLAELPSSLNKLQLLETLDLVVQDDCTMLIPNNVLTYMRRMLHLYFPRLYKRSDDKTKIQLQNLANLEILVNFDATVCDAKVLSKFKKLRILSTLSNGEPRNLNCITNFIDTRADLLEYSSVNIRSFDCYDEKRVQALKKLLQCKFVHSIHIEGQTGKLPEEDDHGKRISDIVLDDSQIEVDPMEYLGMFENLQSLVLKNDAIVGNEIAIAATKPLFCNLRSLKLQNLNYIEKLTIEKGAMPKLSSLQIDSCTSLEKLSMPKELHDRLEKAQWDNKGDTYSILPLPPKFDIIS